MQSQCKCGSKQYIYIPSGSHIIIACSNITFNFAIQPYERTYLYYIREVFFRVTIFLCSPCPNLEGTKDVLCYKFRRPTIGQNCSAVCTNKDGHRDAFSNERHEAPRISRGLLSMQATCHRALSEVRYKVCSLSWSGGRFDV